MKEPLVRLSLGDRTLEFVPAPLSFADCRSADLFGRKNNKTVGQTIEHPKYVGLAAQVLANYSGSLDQGLGVFVLGLKSASDPFYRRFLNRNGDLAYCEFLLADRSLQKLKGLYCFTVGGTVKYIGKSTDSFAKRINQGYGRIHPKNCYRDGQSTNCHLNALIADVAAEVRLHVHPMQDDAAIGLAESALIVRYNPDWNIHLRAFGETMTTDQSGVPK